MSENSFSQVTGRRPKGRMLLTGMLAAAALTAVAVAPSAASATVTPATNKTAKPTVVLVHGAFADSSSWNKVIPKLQRAGYPVIAAANPLRDLNGDSAYVSSVLSSIAGPVILVGHSYGGEVISNAAVGHANVKALVYIAAFVPDEGESGLDLTGKYPGSLLATSLITRDFPLPDGGTGTDAYVDAAKFRAAFAADLPAGDAALMAATQRPASLAALGSPSGAPAWKTLPSWYLVAGSDKAIPAAAERFMAKRAKAHTTEIKGASHVVMISHPDATVDLITAAARATS
ncbi:Pimeloyl-ACP methyl ester carboxylesterase [Streptosporangium subroseum]|uniref:Pimeloyl-ACP methyl ester carboxylesterase n=1 Tax=Streptosporangium subroseum TaxID=106412 RepID=A0A239MYC9_9ACTN|nr:alpha/beta hydrolase [Streptosporangium subroseum]SNT47807.1 Pimeloyl-ACP methyl ester carboxylesterase [Streptosporangium subroseum]